MEKGKEKTEEIRDLLIFGALRLPDPDWLALTWAELVRIAMEVGFPAEWWKREEDRPFWAKIAPDPGLTLGAAREIARKNPVPDPERQFVRETLGKPPFGLKPGEGNKAPEEKNAPDEEKKEKGRSGGPGLFEALFG